MAGHETSSSTLAAVLALLAIHPKEQAEVYEHICEVLAEAGDIAETPLTDKLYKVRSVFLESLRLYRESIRSLNLRTLILDDSRWICYDPRIH